jgi:membrane protein YdbS with pleckstrin-like domain
VALPRKFLNDDEELLAELRPHWIFFAGPLLLAVVTVAGVAALLLAFPHMAGFLSDALMILAVIPIFWLLGRLFRWRNYTLALTTTRVLVRHGILDRDTVQLRLQRITEINLSQKLWERMFGTGRLIIDVQGEDDSLILEDVRKPAIVQRVINGQINELTGGGQAEPVPQELLQASVHRHRQAQTVPKPAAHDTPPFGVPAVADEPRTDSPEPPAPPGTAAPAPMPPVGGSSGEISQRLIELDDLRRRGIISEDEFSAKKAELLNRL